MADESTTYGTPAPETPYSTPISTPRRVPYRINPVKMVRQHVPVKVQSCPETANSTPANADSTSSRHPVNPMQTKRIKCTLQLNSEFHDGVGDQIESFTDDSRIPTPQNLPSQQPASSDIRNKSLSSASNRVEENSKITINASQAERISVCHSGGDAVAVEPQDENINSDLLHTKNVVETVSNSGKSVADHYDLRMERVVASMEKEIRLIDVLVKENSSSYNTTNNVVVNSMQDNKSIEKSNAESVKLSNAEKSKKISLPKKTNCVPDTENEIPTNHKCDKKKFYDPKDIRKYMVKKKSERLAKEREEKNKKANEMAAQKRKTEVTKMFTNRNRFPYYQHTDRDALDSRSKLQNKEMPEKQKFSKKLEKCSHPAVESHSQQMHTAKTKQSYHDAPVNKPSSFSSKEHGALVKKVSKLDARNHKIDNKGSGAREPKFSNIGDFKGIDETEKYFKEKFNDIIAKCVEEASKIVNAELCSPTADSSKILCGNKPNQNSMAKRAQIVENATSPESQTGLDVLSIQNPYNFLNSLKGKTNLTYNVDQHYKLFQQNNPPTSLKIRKTPIKGKRRVDDAKKRPKLEDIAPALNEFLGDYGSLALKNLKSELTLSDLNYTSQKCTNEFGSELREENSDKTYVVCDSDVRRKQSRTSRSTESKENVNTSLEVSGIKPLSFKPFVSTPLMEKNLNNAERLSFSDCNPTEQKPNTKVRISLDRVFSSEEKRDILRRGGFEKPNIASTNLMKVSSLESLTIQDMSTVLPKSCQLVDGKECDVKVDESAVTLPEDYDLLLANSTTLPATDLDGGNEFDENEENRNGILSVDPSANHLQISSSNLLDDLYDQMIKSEDEKLLQILKKIHQQKEALNKYLRSEVFALELQKSQYREKKEEEKVKTIKKKQRGILLKVTKNIIELDKMKKSVLETVEKRKAEILKQKAAMKERKMIPTQKMSCSKPKKKPDTSTRTILISKQMNTLFGFSSSTCTSVILENDKLVDDGAINKNDYLSVNKEFSRTARQETIDGNTTVDKNIEVKDTATSPVHFNAGISIRLDLDPEKLMHLKNSCAEIKIHSTKSVGVGEPKSLDTLQNTKITEKNDTKEAISDETERIEARDNKAIKIKRPLSPAILPPSKKFLQIRRLSSSSEMTLPSLNDTTTTDQSDVELRISALQEQLRQRKLEAERLRKEEKQLRKEKLRSKEQSLLKQLEAYDEYINRVSKMLAENNNFTEIGKPQIKSHPTGRRQLNEKLYDRKDDIEPLPIISNYIEEYSKKLNDDLETNTEDSEKQMRKADSGILIESEITELSENVDLKQKSEHAMTQTQENENSSSPCSEIPTQSVSTNDREKRNTESEEKEAASNDILRTIDDLQSEVHSLSEQLYSLNFDEEIPEDLPETKSDISENISNENNTSMSIEEILSDHHSDGGVKNVVVEKQKANEVISIESKHSTDDLEKRTDIEGNEKIVSGEFETDNVLDDLNRPLVVELDKLDTDAENVTTVTPSVESQFETEKDETIVHEENHGVETNDERLQNLILDAETEESEIHVEIHNIESLSDDTYEDAAAPKSDSTKGKITPENMASDESDKTIQEEDIIPEGVAPSIGSETSTDGEFGLFNIKNVSDIESSELGFGEKQLSEGEIPSDVKDSIVEDVKSISSLEQISQDVESVSKLVMGSNQNETKSSHELIKIDYLNESEGSDVPEVDKGVLPPEEIMTVMDGMKFSTSDASVVVSKSPIDIKRNYNNVLINLKSYFDSKTEKPFDEKATSERIEEEFFQEFAKKPEDLIVTTPIKVVHFAMDNLEETDVSESLEYDAVPVAISDEAIPKHPVTDLDDNTKCAQFSEPIEENVEPGLEAGIEVVPKDSNREEISREKDRSVEEIIEDHSIPNLLGETFVVNEESVSKGNVTEENADSTAPTLEEQVSENLEGNMADEDLEQITEDETPFLQALKRENFIARRKDSLDKMAVDLFETLVEDTQNNSMNLDGQEMNDSEIKKTSIAEETAELSRSEEADEFHELDESFHTSQKLTEFDEKWLEKRLDFDASRLREAEELRLRQLKIEQEIEELQAQQHIPPYIYLREIPNKPPPPYTPPSDHSAKIPGNETELREFIGSTINYVCDAIEKGTEIDNINQLPEYTLGKKKNREVATYKRFIFDLTKEIAQNILEESKKPVSLPWEEVSRQKVPKPRPHKEELQKLIDNEIRTLFGLESKINKEKLIIQWSRKRRTDFVDDLLIQELQEEECEWTNYEEDELIIKNQITENLLDDLINDTVISLQNAIRKKEAKG